MEYDFTTKRVNLLDIANVERAVKDKVYPAGTVYIQVSACRRAGLEQFFATESAGGLESKYAAVLPMFPTDTDYFLEALNRCADEFMYKYVGSNINIQINTFKYFSLDWHANIETQRFIGRFLRNMREQIERVNKEIENVRGLKEYMLNNIMV